MNDLHITLIQSDISWENPEENIRNFGSLVDKLPSPTDLIILPEMFNTGFSINPSKCAETSDGPTILFLKEKSSEKNCMIAGSLLMREGDAYFNRLVCMYPGSSWAQYDKRHLFRLSEEYRILKGGSEKVIVNRKGWNILPLVCYDLRFPVWSRNRWQNGSYDYDILVYCANWPKSRIHIWKSLLTARAIENQCYVIGVNRIGKDGTGTAYSGESLIAGPDGIILDSAPADQPVVIQSTLSMEKLVEHRKNYFFAPDWDRFEIQY